MKSHYKVIMMCMGLSVLLMACSLGRLIPTPEITPVIAREAGMPPSLILFSDDFDNPPTTWTTSQSATGSYIDYEHGGLRIFINDVNFDYWSRPGQRFQDARIAVDATMMSGPENNLYGLICRYQDAENFYAFLISSDGYYGILRVQDASYQMLGSGMMSFNQVILQGQNANRLRADCVGTGLAFSVNGQLLAQIQDSTFTEGEVGLIAGSNAMIGVDILFDNFVVYQP